MIRRALLVAMMLAGAAQAATWQPIPSGTTDDITAIDYHTGLVHYATSGGTLYSMTLPAGAFTLEATFAGRHFYGIAFNPSGTLGLAVADAGHLYRFANGAWTSVSLMNASYNFTTCAATAMTNVGHATPSADLLAVAWASDTVAWVVSAANGQILKSTNAGVSFTDASRQQDQTCRVAANVTDVAPAAGTDQIAWFSDDNMGTVWLTSDQLATAATKKIDLVSCPATRTHVAVEPGVQTRVYAAGECAGAAHWGFTPDNGTTRVYTDSGGPALRDTAGQQGVFIAVGDQGDVEQSFDSVFTYQDTVMAPTNWLAVSLADGQNAAIGGTAGVLAIATDAGTPPLGLSDDFFPWDAGAIGDDAGNPVTGGGGGDGGGCCRTSTGSGATSVAAALLALVVLRRRRVSSSSRRRS